MIQPPKISYRMREYRSTCGFRLWPDLDLMKLAEADLPGASGERAWWVLMELFRDDPYRPLDYDLLASIRANGRRISEAMFALVVDSLRSKGIVVDDQLHPQLLAGWEREWRRCKREHLYWESHPRAEGGAR